jgi:hypothetical protein
MQCSQRAQRERKERAGGTGMEKSKCRMQNDNVKSKKGCAMRDGGVLPPRWGVGKRGRGVEGGTLSGG